MNIIVLYGCLADVSDDIRRAITRMDTLTHAERGALEALWVRLDDLVEQIPPALEEVLKEAVEDARSDEQEEQTELRQDICDLERDIAQLSRELKQAQAGATGAAARG